MFHANAKAWLEDAYGKVQSRKPSASSSQKNTLLQQGISGLRPFYVIFPIRCGRKPGGEGLHAGAPGPSPQEQATFLVGRDSVHMSTGTTPRCFPILSVITIWAEDCQARKAKDVPMTMARRTQSLLWPPRFLQKSSNFVQITQTVEIWISLFLFHFLGSAGMWSQPNHEQSNLPSPQPQPLGLVPLSRLLWWIEEGMQSPRLIHLFPSL